LSASTSCGAAATLAGKPLVAIGGITRENARAVFAAGADAVAVIADLLPAAEPSGVRQRIEEWCAIAARAPEVAPEPHRHCILSLFSRGNEPMSLFRTKSVETILAESEDTTHHLKRTLGPVNLVALGIGAIIGAGLFSLTGIAAADNAGPAVVLSFVVRPSAALSPACATANSPP
jgi:hypothetical protein